VENSDDAIYTTGVEMRPRYANTAFKLIFGYQANELAVLDQYERIHPADVAIVRNAYMWLAQGKAVHGMEYRFCRKDGEWIVLQCNAGILARTGSNETSEFQFVVRDVSETHRRQQQLIRRNSQLTALSTLAAVANSSLKLEDIARNTLQVALESTSMAAGSIHLIEADRKRLRLYVHIDLPAELVETMRELTVGDGSTGSVAETGEVAAFTEGPMNKFGYKILVVVPVKTRGETLGVFSMLSTQDLQFGPDVIKMLTAMGHQLGSVVANVQLYEAQLRENEKLTALLAISGGDTQALELDSLLNRIIHQAAGLLHADAAYIIRYSGERAKVLAATTRLSSLIGAEFPANVGLAGQLGAYRHGRIFSKNEIRGAVSSPVLQQIDPQSVLLVPLFARDASLGTLGLVRETSSATEFTSTDLELMSAFAGRAAVAIDTAQLVHELSQKNEQLELLIEEAHHRIKNSLQMVSSLLQLESIDNPAIAPAIARIQAIAKVHNLLSREMPDNVNGGALITAILDTVKASSSTSAVQMDLDLQEIWLTPDQATALSLITNELASNALKHGKTSNGAPLHLTVQCRQDNGMISIRISDNGGGLPDGFDWKQSTRQGMNIIRQLTNTNLRGEITLTNRDRGLFAELKFQNAVNVAALRA
ncbi:MAG: GAF domain-containing protein, partial [Verrucomicrobiota bacterium]